MIVYKIDILEAMKKKGYSTYRIMKEGILSQSTVTKLNNGDYISLAVLDRICNIIHMQPGSILKWIPDEEAEQPHDDEEKDEWID